MPSGHFTPAPIRILTLEPERLKNRSTTGERITGDGDANRKLLFGPAPFAVHVDIFSGDASLQSQSAILPQLALTAETMWGLDQCYRQSATNRAQRGNLPHLGGDGMFANFGQKFAARLLGASVAACPVEDSVAQLGGEVRIRGFFLATGWVQRFQPIHLREPLFS